MRIEQKEKERDKGEKRLCDKGIKDRKKESEKEDEREGGREGGREWDRRYKYIILNIHKEIEKKKKLRIRNLKIKN